VEKTKADKDEQDKVCSMCGDPAKKMIISNKGCWTLCDRASCWSRLQSRHPQSDLTWMTTPLDEEPPR